MSRLRFLAAGALATVGAVHIPIIPEHLREAPYIGFLFIALAAVCFTLAVIVVAFDDPFVWAVVGVTAGLAVMAYLVSRTVGLPQIGDDVGDWGDPLGVVALTTETCVLILAASTLWRPPSPNPRVHPAPWEDTRLRPTEGDDR